MNFQGMLTEMFPQVPRDIIANFIEDIGSETPEEFEIISDMAIAWTVDNPDENYSAANRNDENEGNNNAASNAAANALINAAFDKPTPNIRIRKLARNGLPRSPLVENMRHTGAIPKRPASTTIFRANINNNITTENSSHYSKLTLVRDASIDMVDFIDLDEIDDPIEIDGSDVILEQFANMLPEADPTYLKEKAVHFLNHPNESKEDFILERLEKKDYPSIEEYLGKLEEKSTTKRYTTEFDLMKFIAEFPNPFERFSKLETPFSKTEDLTVIEDEKQYILLNLYNKYRKLRKTDIEKLLKRNKYQLVKTCDILGTCKEQFMQDRIFSKIDINCTNVGILQVMAYIMHRDKIDAIVNTELERLELARAEAVATNSFLNCLCCYRDDLLPEECVTCLEGCIFCRECVKTGAEHALGDAKTQYKCLSDCESTFTDKTLQICLSRITYLRLTQRRQMEEVAQANITGIETCPFCDYATIPADEDKLFHCENFECKKVSCRKCRHESHLPIRCEEIEYDEDVRMRIAIEDRMSAAMLRFKCAKCAKPIIKDEGCNMITCTCGHYSCYVCKKSINGHGHFSSSSCQLWSNPTATREDILREANKAKEELGVTKDPTILKFDPTKNF